MEKSEAFLPYIKPKGFGTDVFLYYFLEGEK